jgi:hypothetical protein
MPKTKELKELLLQGVWLKTERLKPFLNWLIDIRQFVAFLAITADPVERGGWTARKEGKVRHKAKYKDRAACGFAIPPFLITVSR